MAAPLGRTCLEPDRAPRASPTWPTRGVTHAAMEASSHGLDQHQLDGVRLEAAGYCHQHHPRPSRLSSRFRFISPPARSLPRVNLTRGGTAVINSDDPHGEGPRCRRGERASETPTVGHAEGTNLRLIGQRFDATGQDPALFVRLGRPQPAYRTA